jgi:Ca2+-binding RTX toxin-like protein
VFFAWFPTDIRFEANTFDFNSVGGSPPNGCDTITGYNRGQGDRIDLKAIDADRGWALGNQDFKPSQLIYEKVNGNGLLTVNYMTVMTFKSS